MPSFREPTVEELKCALVGELYELSQLGDFGKGLTSVSIWREGLCDPRLMRAFTVRWNILSDALEIVPNA